MNSLLKKSNLYDIYVKVKAGERISSDDCLRLYESDDLLTIGATANIVRERLNGKKTYYIINRHINYSNICKNRCRFCAFSKDIGEEGAFQLSLDEIFRKAQESLTNRITEFHIVGGLHPELPFSFYIDMLRGLKQIAPYVHIQAFTAVEIDHLANIAGLPVEETLRMLQDAGLDSLPGGGAEVFSSEIRKQLCPEKLSGQGWLDIMRTVHRLGLHSNATMLYGHIESPNEVVDHLERLRNLQDETGGFLSFIPLAFHPENTALSDLLPTSGYIDLKNLAIPRIFLDNFPHIKAFWIMLSVKLAQVSLSFGVDDIDGTVVEEKITHSAGAETPQTLSVKELRRMIVAAGRQPIQRDTLYNIVKN